MTGNRSDKTESPTPDGAAGVLLSHLTDGGFFEGELSSSALATALAAFALNQMDAQRFSPATGCAIIWLCENQNDDGGWGDSPDSPSNRTTTLICRAVLRSLESWTPEHTKAASESAEKWLLDRFGSLDADSIRNGILADYGEDRTFSVPILTLLALAGQMQWQHVPQLPFEWAAMPQRLFRWLNLRVVSYALPALIAIGLVRQRKRRARFAPVDWIRNIFARPALARLTRIQPANGGFLEAAPLTSFVLMSLVGAGEGNSQVARKCADFLQHTQRNDGSWPIDTNLSTWLTSLSVDALIAGQHGIPEPARDSIEGYLLDAQHRVAHPYTGAAPGGWAWTHLPGGVPDADDTAAALVALRHIYRQPDEHIAEAVRHGLRWLMDMQNGNGGIPTFCKGWGRLPFDCSCPDITAHAVRAFVAWRELLPDFATALNVAIERAMTYLRSSQRTDGAWVPLWFGNQGTAKHRNPVYGTAQVLISLSELPDDLLGHDSSLIAGGQQFLMNAQNDDGGWGGDAGTASTIEETALALRAVHASGKQRVVARGAQWLRHNTRNGRFHAAPIGLYFARLWYSEKLYPIIHTAAAQAALEHVLNPDPFMRRE